jgi:hypothetical protein
VPTKGIKLPVDPAHSAELVSRDSSENRLENANDFRGRPHLGCRPFSFVHAEWST